MVCETFSKSLKFHIFIKSSFFPWLAKNYPFSEKDKHVIGLLWASRVIATWPTEIYHMTIYPLLVPAAKNSPSGCNAEQVNFSLLSSSGFTWSSFLIFCISKKVQPFFSAIINKLATGCWMQPTKSPFNLWSSFILALLRSHFHNTPVLS